MSNAQPAVTFDEIRALMRDLPGPDLEAGTDELVVVDQQDTDHGSGTSNRTVVPASGADRIWSRAPASSVRLAK